MLTRSIGMNYFNLTYNSLDVVGILDKVKSPDCGAVSLFVGTARDNFNGEEVIGLFYEAYEKMALKKFEEICVEIRSKWTSVVNIAMQHRLGEVSILENIVVAAIATPHRADGLAALTFLLDRMKKTLPIWKKENYKHAKGAWKENVEAIRLNGCNGSVD